MKPYRDLRGKTFSALKCMNSIVKKTDTGTGFVNVHAEKRNGFMPIVF